MKSSYVALIFLLISILFALVFYDQIDSFTLTESHETCIPTFPDGDGPYYKANAPFRKKLVPNKNNGEKLTVRGKLLRNDCKTTVGNAVIDIWQADETGKYQDELYRGRIRTDKNGNYTFETVIPKGYGAGTAYRPPHIHFKIWENDKLLITSEMFFPEVKGKPGFEDAYIMQLSGSRGYHDIILP